MELHKAIKEIVTSRGAQMVGNIQIINFLLDYQAFKEKPATKLILRDIINSGYAEEILSLDATETGWQTKFKKYQHEFIDSCGYKEELATYVFEAIAFGIGLNIGDNEPEIKREFNIDSFFNIPEADSKDQEQANSQQQNHDTDPSDLYTIALSFYKEGKFEKAKGFLGKAISLLNNNPIPSLYLKLMAEILIKMDDYTTAITYYNECFKGKAIEEKMSINLLRNSLTKHEVKGFENCMFNYFFCLYYLGQIADSQWVPFVKNEAIYGLLDAITYCADYGINPIDSHIDIYFTDRNQIKNGDFLYSDGTFAHELSESKKVVAIIQLMETSDYEKQQGWNRGYIIPVGNLRVNEKRYFWGSEISTAYQWSTICIDLPFPHSHYTIDDLNHWEKAQKINSECYIRISDYDKYPVFKAAHDFNVRMPISGTSTWFVPNVILVKRLLGMGRYAKYIGAPYSGYWTSSQADANNAISFHPRYESGRYGGPRESFQISPKTESKVVIPIAAF